AENPLRDGHPPTPAQIATLEKELSTTLAEITKSQTPAQTATHTHQAPTNPDPQALQNLQTLLTDLAPLIDQRNFKAQESLPALSAIPQAAILARQIEDFDFATAAESLKTLRKILD
ncbi:MAG: hypothetical protein FWB71_05150, partial [Defluviitaleaceae bacterium]|nr:hypothetical protein [Defluviitaleaceae bacterium]